MIAAISRWWNGSARFSLSASAEGDCAFCLGPLQENSPLFHLGENGVRHAFHSACLYQQYLMEADLKCPLCRVPITHLKEVDLRSTEAKEKIKHRLLWSSAEQGNQETVQFLLRRGLSTQEATRAAFLALTHNHFPLFETLKPQVQPGDLGIKTECLRRIHAGELDQAQAILPYVSWDAATLGNTWVECAQKGYHTLLQLLLPIVPSRDAEALQPYRDLAYRIAVQQGRRECVRELRQWPLSEAVQSQVREETSENPDLQRLLPKSKPSCTIS